MWNRFSFLVKVSIRNVLRYKKRFFMMVVGIGGCTALLVTGFGVKDSIANIAGQQFTSVQTYGMSVLLKEGYTTGEWDEVEEYLQDESLGYTRAAESAMDAQLPDGGTKSLTVIVPEDASRFEDYWDLHTEDGESIPFPEEGQAVVNAEFARRNGYELGDTISLSDEDGNELSLRIVGLSENYIYNYLYLSADSWESQNREAPDYRSIYLKTDGVADEHVLLARLMNFDAVSSVTVNADTLDRFDNMMSSMNYIVLVIIVCAGALAFIVLYNLYQHQHHRAHPGDCHHQGAGLLPDGGGLLCLPGKLLPHRHRRRRGVIAGQAAALVCHGADQHRHGLLPGGGAAGQLPVQLCADLPLCLHRQRGDVRQAGRHQHGGIVKVD